MIHKKYRLLLIDDDPLTLHQAAAWLAGNGYDVTTLEDGVEALLHLEAEDWDLVLLDLLLPGPTGLEVLQQIRRSRSMLNLPVIMMTSRNERSQMVAALDAGANDYLIKPIDGDIALARIRTQLNCTELATAKDEFLSFASHDLKKPLMLMQDVANELHRRLVPGTCVDGRPQKDLECLIQSARQMMNVVEGFLNSDCLSSGSMKLDLRPTSLNAIVAEVVQENIGYAESKQIQLNSIPQNDLPNIQADPQKLRGVIDNLIGNAIKFGPAGTRVTVSTRAGQNNLYLSVCDSGPGLGHLDMEKLFTRGTTPGNKPTGQEISSGIGLFLCGSLIKQHGGQIGAENNAGGGATFWIALPVPDALTPAEDPGESMPASVQRFLAHESR
ncbi:MAG: HAMP domain-containing sensor histidine kinase [Thiogranum sp.]|nr:HAMP domain-containing sensor histidine kinase [Thiogranum sp.]